MTTRTDVSRRDRLGRLAEVVGMRGGGGLTVFFWFKYSYMFFICYPREEPTAATPRGALPTRVVRRHPAHRSRSGSRYCVASWRRRGRGEAVSHAMQTYEFLIIECNFCTWAFAGVHTPQVVIKARKHEDLFTTIFLHPRNQRSVSTCIFYLR